MSEHSKDNNSVQLVHIEYEDDLKCEHSLKYDKLLKYEDDIESGNYLKSEHN